MAENRALAKTPVGDFAHFNERRGVERSYHKNPDAQARGAMFLIGLLACHEEFGPLNDRSSEVAAAIRVVLKDFVLTYPEFLIQGKIEQDFGGGIYTPDERLVRAVHDAVPDLDGRE